MENCDSYLFLFLFLCGCFELLVNWKVISLFDVVEDYGSIFIFIFYFKKVIR
jgi:hypothetical protein